MNLTKKLRIATLASATLTVILFLVAIWALSGQMAGTGVVFFFVTVGLLAASQVASDNAKNAASGSRFGGSY